MCRKYTLTWTSVVVICARHSRTVCNLPDMVTKLNQHSPRERPAGRKNFISRPPSGHVSLSTAQKIKLPPRRKLNSRRTCDQRICNLRIKIYFRISIIFLLHFSSDFFVRQYKNGHTSGFRVPSTDFSDASESDYV